MRMCFSFPFQGEHHERIRPRSPSCHASGGRRAVVAGAGAGRDRFGQGSSATHRRRAVRRRAGRPGDGLEPQRPPGADGGGVGHPQPVQQPAPICLATGRCPHRFHRSGRTHRAARRSGDFLSRVLRRRPERCRQRTLVRPFAQRAANPPRHPFCLERRHRRPRLRHQPGHRRHAHLRSHALAPAGLLYPQRRHHLRRRPGTGATDHRKRPGVAQHHQRSQEQSRAKPSTIFAATTATT